MDMVKAIMTAPLLAIGLGCKSGVTADAVVALVEEAVQRVNGKATGLYTIEDKQGEAALGEAAARLGLPLIHLPQGALEAAAPRAVTKSERVLALFGVPSIAETAALAGAGPGALLVLPRISAGGVTCAIATLAPALREPS